jgi:hypothetical protein
MNMGWMPEYVEDNLTTTLQKSLNRVWERCLPLPAAASLLCQHFKIWEPKRPRNLKQDWNALGGMMGGIKRV